MRVSPVHARSAETRIYLLILTPRRTRCFSLVPPAAAAAAALSLFAADLLIYRYTAGPFFFKLLSRYRDLGGSKPRTQREGQIVRGKYKIKAPDSISPVRYLEILRHVIALGQVRNTPIFLLLFCIFFEACLTKKKKQRPIVAGLTGWRTFLRVSQGIFYSSKFTYVPHGGVYRPTTPACVRNVHDTVI